MVISNTVEALRRCVTSCWLLALALSGASLLASDSPLTAGLPSLPTWPGDASKVVGQQRAFLTDDGTEVVVLLERETGLEEVRVPLRNRILPSLAVSIDRLVSGGFRYRYEVRNLAESSDEMGVWSLVAPVKAPIEMNHLAPFETRWGGAAHRAPIADMITPGAEPGRYVSWIAATWEGREGRPTLKPGEGRAEALKSFRTSSQDLQLRTSLISFSRLRILTGRKRFTSKSKSSGGLCSSAGLLSFRSGPRSLLMSALT